ncbi:hypothetical protein T12_6339 [Trichinella patagoniensis]|uniref:Uncharacterized protein n=1 Tax=Trichinella patagoniensis TaxID=990121 RepID=A0A0V0ZBY6_9BILA|nr:hypothetical protein T12_6339 [Trichinella patagoniensis]
MDSVRNKGRSRFLTPHSGRYEDLWRRLYLSRVYQLKHTNVEDKRWVCRRIKYFINYAISIHSIQIFHVHTNLGSAPHADDCIPDNFNLDEEGYVRKITWKGAQLMSTLLTKWKGRQLERKAGQKKQHSSSPFMMMKRLLICPPLASSRCNLANSVVPND